MPKTSGKSPPSTNEGWIATKEDPATEIAVVYDGESSTKCGCALRLAPLMDYLESTAISNMKTTCPVCRSPIEVVMVKPPKQHQHHQQQQAVPPATFGSSRNVTFKYRKHLYKLAVEQDPSANNTMPFPYSIFFWMWCYTLRLAGEDVTNYTAQERVAQVLRMDLHGGMRILHKGKILFPNTHQSAQTISEQLLTVCEKGGKPLVMGTRMTERQQKIATLRWCYNVLYRLVSVLLTKAIDMVRGIVSPFMGGGGPPPAAVGRGTGSTRTTTTVATIDNRPHRD